MNKTPSLVSIFNFTANIHSRPVNMLTGLHLNVLAVISNCDSYFTLYLFLQTKHLLATIRFAFSGH